MAGHQQVISVASQACINCTTWSFIEHSHHSALFCMLGEASISWEVMPACSSHLLSRPRSEVRPTNEQCILLMHICASTVAAQAEFAGAHQMTAEKKAYHM